MLGAAYQRRKRYVRQVPNRATSGATFRRRSWDSFSVSPSQVLNEQTKSNSVPAPTATLTRTVGIIHPPPETRTIVDKTAQFVSKNGPDFEKRITASNANNAKFSFLSPAHPYHTYYRHRVSEFRAQKQSSTQQSVPTGDDGSV